VDSDAVLGFVTEGVGVGSGVGLGVGLGVAVTVTVTVGWGVGLALGVGAGLGFVAALALPAVTIPTPVISPTLRTTAVIFLFTSHLTSSFIAPVANWKTLTPPLEKTTEKMVDYWLWRH